MRSENRLLILASGGGTTFTHLARQDLGWKICGLLTDRNTCKAVGIAEDLEIPATICSAKDFPSAEAWDEALTEQALKFAPHLVLLAGFLRKLGPKFLSTFKGRVINTHPSLLPKYGGHGMYGAKVHEAVVANKEKFTGISIHQVEGEYDTGSVLDQLRIEVLPTETGSQLEERLKAKEKEFLANYLKKISSN